MPGVVPGCKCFCRRSLGLFYAASDIDRQEKETETRKETEEELLAGWRHFSASSYVIRTGTVN